MLGLPSVSSIAFSNAKVQKIICALRKINVKTHKKDTFGQFAPLEHIYNKVYVEVHVRYMCKKDAIFMHLFNMISIVFYQNNKLWKLLGKNVL